MKTLTTVLESAVTPLYESLLDDFDDLEKVSNSDIKSSIIDFVENNYKGVEKITISDNINDDGKYIVDIKGRDIQSGQNIKKLINNFFIFGTIKGNFKCINCHSLISLEGAPQKVEGNFVCHSCINLTSLEGAPQKVGGNFVCDWCESLTNLNGSPKEVGKNFNCNYCDSLKSLEGAPEKVGGNFECVECDRLQSLKGAPKEVGDSFRCSFCKGEFQESDVRKYCKKVVQIICKVF